LEIPDSMFITSSGCLST